MPKTIEVTRTGDVVLVRINRPKQLNALNSDVAREMITELAPLDSDPSVGCIVLTGNEKAFAAGADISEMVGKSYHDMATQNFFHEWDEFAQLRTPKIAAVNGYALGGGCEVAMMCDFIIAGEGAQFGQPEVKLGVMAGMGGSQRMTKLIGRAKSMDMHLTGRMMGAAEALTSGLIARVVSDDVVLDEAMKTAHKIAGYSNISTAFIREAVNRADEGSLAEGILWERRVFHSMFGSDDQIEGMNAFLEKRKPNFTN